MSSTGFIHLEIRKNNLEFIAGYYNTNFNNKNTIATVIAIYI